MNTITPVTETHQVNGRTYITTTWIHGEHQLTRITREGDDTIDRWTTEGLRFDTPRVDEDLRGLDKVTYEVNWGSRGAMNAKDARAYAERITDAALAAEQFTEIRAGH